MQQFILSNRPVSRNINTKQHGVLLLMMSKTLNLLVGAYRHPDKNFSDSPAEISWRLWAVTEPTKLFVAKKQYKNCIK